MQIFARLYGVTMSMKKQFSLCVGFGKSSVALCMLVLFYKLCRLPILEQYYHPRTRNSSMPFCWSVSVWQVLVPLAFATVQPQVLTSLHQDFYHFSTIAIYSLLPLIFTSQEYPIKLCLLFAHILIVQIIRPVCRKTDGGMRTAWGHLPKIHTLGLILIEAYSVLLHERMLKHRFPFLPLMVTSVYCSIGIFGYWVKWSILFLKNISNAGGNFSKLIQKWDVPAKERSIIALKNAWHHASRFL